MAKPNGNEQKVPPKRQHKATYASDKRKGGWMIRIVGPNAQRFAGREVPVTTKGDQEHMEQLESLIWAGMDQESGEPVALYRFKPKPQQQADFEF